jgi:DNA-binding winged helix-turn-helix (wHTH) protein
MTIAWIIEKPKQSSLSIVQSLIGDVPVRAFSSVKSFVRLSAAASRLPDIILVSAEDFSDEWENLINLIQVRIPCCRTLFISVGGKGDFKIAEPMRLNVTSFEQLPFLLQPYLSDSKRRDSILRVGDIHLDFEAARVKTLFDEEWVHLTPKEALILKTFLTQPESCLSHEDICESVWRGVKISHKSLASHISKVRKYISGSQFQILSVYGGGYRLSNSGAKT